jgi:hypothetical protein
MRKPARRHAVLIAYASTPLRLPCRGLRVVGGSRGDFLHQGGADARGACGADRGEGLWRGPPPFRQAEMGLAQLVAHAPCPLPTVPETGCAPTNARPCGVGSVIRNTDRGPQALLLGSGRHWKQRCDIPSRTQCAADAWPPRRESGSRRVSARVGGAAMHGQVGPTCARRWRGCGTQWAGCCTAGPWFSRSCCRCGR